MKISLLSFVFAAVLSFFYLVPLGNMNAHATAEVVPPQASADAPNQLMGLITYVGDRSKCRLTAEQAQITAPLMEMPL